MIQSLFNCTNCTRLTIELMQWIPIQLWFPRISVSRLSNYFPCSSLTFSAGAAACIFLRLFCYKTRSVTSTACMESPVIAKEENRTIFLEKKLQTQRVVVKSPRGATGCKFIFFYFKPFLKLILHKMQVCQDCESEMWKYCDLPSCPWHEKRPQHVDNHGSFILFNCFLSLSLALVLVSLPLFLQEWHGVNWQATFPYSYHLHTYILILQRWYMVSILRPPHTISLYSYIRIISCIFTAHHFLYPYSMIPCQILRTPPAPKAEWEC